MSLNKINHVLLTGPPGIGKTTAIQDIYELMKTKKISVVGFYTKEVRDINHHRIGFDVVTLDGKSGVLARTKGNKTINQSRTYKYMIGKYEVFLDEFESLVLPLFRSHKDSIFIIDEIGKMELFSRSFEASVEKLFKTPDIKIIATIPVTKIKPISFVEKLKSMPCTTVIAVDYSNRNDISGKALSVLNI